MHPLLVSAVASTAGNFLERWARGSGTPAAQKTPETQFESVMDARQAAQTTAAPKTPEQIQQERTLELRRQLLDAPEIRAVLDSADPAKPPTLSLGTDGRVMEARPGGYGSHALLLSPETADIARELASLTATTSSVPLSGPTPPSLQQARAMGYDLTPRATFASARS